METVSFPARALAIRRATARLCLRLGWAPLHEVPLPNGRRADILALRPDGAFACIEVKSGIRDFLSDQKWPEHRANAQHRQRDQCHEPDRPACHREQGFAMTVQRTM